MKPFRILLVAMPESIHTARWVSQLEDRGWEIHLFPSSDAPSPHEGLRNVIVHMPLYTEHVKDKDICRRGLYIPAKNWRKLVNDGIKHFFPARRVQALANLIRRIRPNVVHALEIQHAGYLALEAKKRLSGEFPPWVVTNWGSDIYLFGRLSEHEPKIRAVLAECDYYSCECQRDVCLAKAYGFNGQVLPVFPNTGGFDLVRVAALRQPGLVSARRLIMLKGYQGWAGRALTGLRALERCVEILRGYEVAIYCAAPEVVIAAELFQKETGIPITIIPENAPHEELLRLHGRARIAIGLSISDAISTSLLESLVMGAFPVQSWTACADEWLEDGKTGILVHPEDSDVVEKAIRRALTDEELVDSAAENNYRMAAERLDQAILKPKAINIYNFVFQETVDKANKTTEL